jgi:hypothetical protein
MDQLSRRDILRVEALRLAAGRGPEVFREADDNFAWLIRRETVKIKVVSQVIRDGEVIWTDQVTVGTPEGNEPLMTAMQDADTATITLEPEDSMGEPTGDSLVVTQDDGGTPTTGGAPATPGSVANITYALDSTGKITDITLAPVGIGNVTVTVNDPSAPSVAPFVNTFSVAAGETSSLVANITVNTGANTPPAPSA